MQNVLRLTGAFKLAMAVVTIVVTVVASGCANMGKLSAGGTRMAQIPITDSPSGQTFPGKIVWRDLLTTDPRAAGTFYAALFGWEIEYDDDYSLVHNDGKRIAGILKIDASKGYDHAGMWIPTASVTNLDVAIDQVKTNGGRIKNGPIDMEKRGRTVLISDSQGADMALITAKGGDAADVDAAVGDWLWDEIWTHDPETTTAFYSSVLGYDEVSGDGNYRIFLQHRQWRAGVRHVLDDNKHLFWVPVVRVADPEAVTQRVEELGGVVWITPEEAPDGRAETALISDPTGALFLIQQWPSTILSGAH